MFNICLECVKLFNIAVHNYDVFRFKFVHIHYTDKLYCLKLIKVKVKSIFHGSASIVPHIIGPTYH